MAGVPSSCPPRPTRPTAPAQRSLQQASHATAARSGPHGGAGGAPRACPGAYGLRDRPTTRFSSAAGSRDRPRRATARDGMVQNAQVWGRASGVCCERGWAAGLAAGRRAGAHRTCARGRGDTGRRTESCPPRPTHRRRPPNAAVEDRPTLRRRDPAPTPRCLPACHAQGRTTLGLRDRPTTRFSSAAGRIDGARRATARDGVHNNAQVVGRASGVCCERGWAARWAAGRRAGAHRTCGRYARRLWPAAPRWPAARRTRRRPPNAAFTQRPTLPRRDPAPTPRPWRRATRMAGKRWG